MIARIISNRHVGARQYENIHTDFAKKKPCMQYLKMSLRYFRSIEVKEVEKKLLCEKLITKKGQII
jgi:hypothetical protein